MERTESDGDYANNTMLSRRFREHGDWYCDFSCHQPVLIICRFTKDETQTWYAHILHVDSEKRISPELELPTAIHISHFSVSIDGSERGNSCFTIEIAFVQLSDTRTQNQTGARCQQKDMRLCQTITHDWWPIDTHVGNHDYTGVDFRRVSRHAFSECFA